MKIGDLVNIHDRGIGFITAIQLKGIWTWASVWMPSEKRVIAAPKELIKVIKCKQVIWSDTGMGLAESQWSFAKVQHRYSAFGQTAIDLGA